MNITTIGVDLAKEIITVYAQDASGGCAMSRNFEFKKLANWLVRVLAYWTDNVRLRSSPASGRVLLE